MKKMKGFLTQAATFLVLLTASGFGSYYLCMAIGSQSVGPTPIEPDHEPPLKPSEILMSSLTSLETFDVDGELSFTYQPSLSQGKVYIDASADASDLTNLKIKGDLALNFGASKVNASATYIDETLYLDYNDSHLKMSNANILSFIDMLSSLNINVALPDSLVNLDLAGLLGKIEAMEPLVDPDGYVFELAIDENISLFFKSDFNYEFTGLRTNKFFYQDMFAFLDVDIVRTSDNNPIVSPESVEGSPIYQSMEPLTNLFKNLYHTFNSKTNTFDLNVTMKDENLSPLINLAGNLSFDLNVNQYALDFSLNENARSHNFELYYLDKTIYLNQGDVNFISVQSESIASLVSYLLQQIGDEALSNFLTSVSNGLAMDEIMNILSNLENLNSWITKIDVSEGKTSITFDLSVFGLEMEAFTLSLSSTNELIGVSLDDVSYGGYHFDLDLNQVAYDLKTPEVSKYVAIDPAFNLVPTIFNLTKQNRFRIELAGEMVSSEINTPKLTLDGGFQFDVYEKFGFGELTLVDRSNYSHRIQADYRKDNNLLMAYNSNLRAKMDGNAIEDVINMIKDVINNRDEHFMELFGDIITMIESTPLYTALMGGDYGLLLATPSISNLNVTNTLISFNLSGALFGFDDLNMLISIRYDESNLYGLDISNVTFGNETLSISLDLKAYDASLEESRLKISDTYFDFNDLKLFLELGINTAIHNDYHFEGNVNLNLLNIMNVDLPVDIKIKNESGNVSLAIDLPDVPVIAAVNDNTDYIQSSVFNIERSASIYYKDGLIYLEKTDYDQKTGLFSAKYDVTYTQVVDVDTFFGGILDYLLEFILDLRDMYLNMIETSTPNTEGQIIHYENLINDLEYNSSGQYFYLDFNLYELTKNEDLSNILIKVYADEVKKELKGIDVTLNINVGVSISLNASLTLVNLGEEVDMSKMNNFVSEHQNDELGVTKVYEVKA